MPAFYVWRVARAGSAANFPPHEYAWKARGRFSDPQSEFRTLYCSGSPWTAVREAVARFRADAKMIEQFQVLFPNQGEVVPAAGVPREWLEGRVLVELNVAATSELVDVEDQRTRRRLERRFPSLLVRHGMSHLDLSELRGPQREITQAVARFLYDEGAAGVLYRSHLDNERCYAFFEGRVEVTVVAEDSSLEESSYFAFICREFSLGPV